MKREYCIYNNYYSVNLAGFYFYDVKQIKKSCLNLSIQIDEHLFNNKILLATTVFL